MPLHLPRKPARFPVLVTVRLSDQDAATLRTFCLTHDRTPGEVFRDLIQYLPADQPGSTGAAAPRVPTDSTR